MIRLIGYFFGIGVMLMLLVAAAGGVYIGHLTKDLPDYEVLAKYEPPVTTRIHASDGSLMGEFAHERRLYIPIQAVPDRVKAAFLSAEDKNFYNHPRRRHHRPVSRRGDQFPEHGLGQAPGRRLDHHPAGGQELPAQPTRPTTARSRR